MSIQLSAAATSGTTTGARFELTTSQLPATVSAPALASAEVVDIHISQDGGSTYAATGLQLTATENTKIISGPGIYRTVKAASVASIAVHLHTDASL
jgi:hypothetical protein